MKHKYDVVVAGAGPAGMAAAMALAEHGVETAVIDDNILPGGQVFRRPPVQFKLRDTKSLGVNYQKGEKIIGRFEGFGERIAFYSKAAIIAFFNECEMSLVQNGEYREIQFEKLIICEGATERVIPFPGWTLPGVMTAGGLQKLLLNQGILPGKRIVLSGTGPLLLSVAASILSAGGKIAAYLESCPRRNTFRLLPELLRRKGVLRESISYLLSLLKHLVSIRQPYAVVSAEGCDRVETATISRLGADGRPITSTYKRIKADVIGINHGFLPSTRLTRHMGCEHKYDSEKGYLIPVVDRFMRTSLDTVYAAGDGTGIGGAAVAEIEGRIAGLHAASSLGRIGKTALKEKLAPVLAEHQSLVRFSDALFSVFKYRPGLFDILTQDTVVCRCEQVTAGKIWAEIEMGSKTLIDLKPARFAMGRCQGRVCEAIVCEILRQKGIDPAHLAPLHIRPPVIPLSISAIENKVH